MGCASEPFLRVGTARSSLVTGAAFASKLVFRSARRR
jgi:hypothetical protein